MKIIALAFLLSATTVLPQEPVLGVDDAVSAALAAQPRLRAAESQVRAAEAREQQADWSRLGTLDPSLVFTPVQKSQQIEFPGFPPAIPPSTFEMDLTQKYAFSVSFNQPLWTWGALSIQLASTRAGVEGDRGSLEWTRQQTIYEARLTFGQAALAIEATEVYQQACAHQQELLRVAQLRVQAGSAARLDELKAELALVQAESALTEAGNRERLARERLVSFTMDPRFRIAALEPLKDDGHSLPAEEEAVGRALAERPDVKALKAEAKALRLSAEAVRASGLPALGLQASLTQQSDTMSQVFRRDNQAYQVALAVSWDAFAPGRSRARVAEVLAQERTVVESLHGVESSVALEVRTAIASTREARQREVVQRHAVVVAEEQARIARLAYQEGTITAVEAEDAELALTGARFAVLRARLDAALAKAALCLALGE